MPTQLSPTSSRSTPSTRRSSRAAPARARSRRSSRAGRRAGLEADVLEGTPGRPSVLVRARGTGGGGRCCCAATSTRSTSRGWRDPHAPRVDGDRLYGRGALRHEGRRRRGAGRRAATRPRSACAGDVVVAAVADEEHASLGVQEALRRVARRRGDRHRADRARARRRAQGLRLVEIEVTGRAAHGSRPHLGVDAIVKAGPILTALGELDDALGGRDASAARPRLGPRVGRSRAARSCRATRRAACSGSSAGRCRARPRRTSRRELAALLDRCRAADPRSRPSSARCSCASRSRSTPDAELVDARPRRRGRGARRAAARSAARATGPTPRSSPPPASRPSCSARAARARTPSRSG